MSTVADFLTDAALALGATQLGEALTADESAVMQRAWQRLIDSLGLESANIHTIRNDVYPLIGGQTDYTLGYDPTADGISVSAASNASPVVLTLAAAHGLTVGQTNSVVIEGGAGNWQAINGGFIATVLSSTTLSIPVNSTSFGSLTGAASLTIGGSWNYVRPTKIRRMKLDWHTGLLTEIRVTDYEGQANIQWTQVTAPVRQAYPDYNAPLCTVKLFPIPDSNYNVQVYSEQALENVGSLVLTDEISFAQGYERLYVLNLAIECAPIFGIMPTEILIETAEKAISAVKAKNRRAPILKGDPALSKTGRGGFSYRSGLDINRI